MRRLADIWHGDDSGHSLPELLVVMTLVSVILAGAYMVLLAVSTANDIVQAKAAASDQTRMILDRMTRELRQAQESVEGEGVFDDMQPRRCSFYSDIDHDGVPERVTYRIQGKVLYRTQAAATTAVPPYTFGSDAPETELARSLDGGWNGNVFTYYDDQEPADEVSAGHAEDCSAVSLRLVNSATVGKKTAFVDLSTWVKIRSVHNTID